jgi:undecaprenyl-diphosphatase
VEGGVVWRRHPADVARLVAAGLALGAVLLVAAVEPDALTNLSRDVVRTVGRFPAPVRNLLSGLLQVLALAAPLALLGWAVWRRAWRPLAVVVTAAGAAAVAMVLLTDWLDRVAPPQVLAAAELESWVTGRAFPSGTYVAALAGAVTAASPLLHRRWRRAVWLAVGLAAVLRLASAAAVPVNVGAAVLIGVVAGSAVLLALGAPARRPSPAAITRATARAGVEVDDLVPVDAGDRQTFRGRGGDGAHLFVAVVGRDDRDADLLYRGWRRLRVKGIDDELAGIRPGPQVRQEALAGLLAHEAGASVATIQAVGETEDDDGVLVQAFVEGTPLVDLAPEAVTDDLLRATWEQVRRLHDRHLAHRRLSTDQVLVGADGTPTVIGLRWAQVGADELLLAADVAELLVATAVAVGPERAVAAAQSVIDPERLVAALPLLQPLALSPSTRRLVRRDKALVEAVRDQAQSVTGADEIELFELERIGWGQILGAFGFVFLSLVVISFVSNWGDISEALREADWSRLPLTLVLAFLTFPAGAVSLMGAVLRPLPLGRTTTVMFAQSFLNRFTPMNAGGMAMRVRYLQKGGTDVAVAATAVGITSAASGVMQVVLIVGFVLWAGNSPGGALSFPDIESIALVLLAVAAVAGLVAAFPAARRFVLRWMRVGWDKVGGEFRSVAGRPTKLAQLFGGAGLSKLFTISCFVASCRALGIGIGYADLGMLYLVGSSIGAAVPSPGGVGGVEAALIAVLTGAGVDDASAAAAVVVFRLVTYWLPVLPGYLCLRYARRAELV